VFARVPHAQISLHRNKHLSFVFVKLVWSDSLACAMVGRHLAKDSEFSSLVFAPITIVLALGLLVAPCIRHWIGLLLALYKRREVL
jgi:hypothetical protein